MPADAPKIIFLSTSNNIGGAAKATYKLYHALKSFPLDLRMVVKKKQGEDSTITEVRGLLPATAHVMFDNFLLSFYKKSANRSYWSLARLPNFHLKSYVRNLSCDIVQLNWVNAGFVPISLLSAVQKPMVWRLSDSWCFTGGCHVPFECTRYTSGCGKCPQLGSHDLNDISRRTVRMKADRWQNVNLTIVAPSKWMQQNAKMSLLFKDRRVEYIPSGVDTSIFKPLPKEVVRKKLSLASDKKIILFGAVDAVADHNKGFALLVDALHRLSEVVDKKKILLVVFGHAGAANVSLPFHAEFVGLIQNQTELNEYYCAADVYAFPSKMENSPNTVLESMAAGTPVVAFQTSGITELIDSGDDSILVEPFSTTAFASALRQILESPDQAKQMGAAARLKIESRYDIQVVASQYYDLYRRILENDGK